MGARDIEVKSLVNKYHKWSKKEFYTKKLNQVVSYKNQIGHKKIIKAQKSPFHDIETEVYKDFVEKRKNAQRLSTLWIKCTAMKYYNEMKEEKYQGTEFKASFGWVRRFIKHKNIKFRKRKCGKERTAEECIKDFEEFLYKMRFDFLDPIEEDGASGRDPLWGRFPPSRRYNMDQSPLPFVNGQDVTFTMEDDNDVNIKCPKESLRKRQFTMHLVFNASEGDDRDGWCDLVCKGTGKRIKDAEKELWDEDVDVFWQSKAWVDKVVMLEIAKKFVRRKIAKHGEDVWVILFCDNLSAHCDPDVRKIFGDNKVFLCFYPPNMTNFIQPIDAGLARSVRIAVGNYLDKWLMDGENLLHWENKWTASERRILISDLVGKAMRYVMHEDRDQLRVSCFERTGSLMTWLPNDTHDTKIRPQGMPKEKFTVPQKRRLQLDDDPHEDVSLLSNGVPADQVALMEERVVLAEMGEFNGEDLVLSDEDKDDDEDNGEIIDDNPNTST